MIKATIGELLDGALDKQANVSDSIVYIVREGDLVFYIGESANVIERLWSHLGQGSFGWAGDSELGRLIKDNLPAARDWQVELLTIEDCVSVIENLTDLRFEVASTGVYLPQEPVTLDGFTFQPRIKFDRKDLECEVIRAYKPCLNTACNPTPTPLPEKYHNIYQRHPLADELDELFRLV